MIPAGSLLLRQDFPILIQNGNSLMGCEIELAWNHRNIIIGNRPFIIVLPFVKIHEVSHHPEVASSIGVRALVKVLPLASLFLILVT